MGLTPGSRLGAYEIVGLIGAGGMGEVYRARDTRLDRTVAIKILPDSLAEDPLFRERFDREARAISQLTHPHICVLHDVGHQDGHDFLVMEYLEGETLEQRLNKGALPINQALQYAMQTADALDKAHRSGIVHRDLKPGNIMLTKSGAKLLDFGLAKSATSAGAVAGLSILPTTPPGLTAQGTILGTFQYMAPEQLEGKEADARTDIFAFGAVLYEMLTGKRAFEAKSQASLIARILDDQPPPPSTVQPLTPRALDRVAATCLAKDPDDRWQSARDLMRELTWISGGGNTTDEATTRVAISERRTGRVWAFGLAAGVVIGAIVSALVVRPLGGRASQRPSPDVTRLIMDVAPADQLQATPVDTTWGLGRPGRTAMVFAPDGRSIVFNAIRSGQQQLYRRSLAELKAEPIAGTEGGYTPFFSPDGKWIGFWAIDGLRKVPFPRGGPVVKVCDTPYIFGASWAANDTIVFAQRTGGLWQVAAAGGSPRSLTTLDPTNGEFSHRLPFVLPGSKAVLFTVTRELVPNWDRTEIVIQSLLTGERRVLIDGGADARYVPTGHLVYMRAGTLMAVPFDLVQLKVTGGAVALIADVMQAITPHWLPIDSGDGQFSVSASGALVYLPGGLPPDVERSLFWVDRSGAERPLSLPPLAYFSPRLSPDGQRLAFSTSSITNMYVGVYDLLRGGRTRLTTEGRYGGASWTPDGKRVAFTSKGGLFSRVVDGSGPVEPLGVTSSTAVPHSWTPDGSTLALIEFSSDTTEDIFVLALDGDRRPEPLIRTPFIETGPEFSPDGHWLAYASTESGRHEVYVQPYPGPGARHPISTEGGIQPAWSRDRRELFFTTLPSPDGIITMMAVPVSVSPTFSAGAPRVLFKRRYASTSTTRFYDVAPDGRFLMMRDIDRPPMKPTQMIFVQHWDQELKQRVPTN